MTDLHPTVFVVDDDASVRKNGEDRQTTELFSLICLNGSYVSLRLLLIAPV
jgi:hypothetical protein